MKGVTMVTVSDRRSDYHSREGHRGQHKNIREMGEPGLSGSLT